MAVSQGKRLELNSVTARIILRDCGFQFYLNWDNLGSDLGVPLDERRRLRGNAMSLNGDFGLAMEECLDHWILNGSPSWEGLIELVEKYEKSTGEAMRMRLNIEPAPRKVRESKPESTEERGSVGNSSNPRSPELTKFIRIQDDMQALLQVSMNEFASKCVAKHLISSAVYGKIFNPSSSSDSERAGYFVYQIFKRIQLLEIEGKKREAQEFIQKFARVIKDTDVVFREIGDEIAQTRDSLSFLEKQDRIKSSIQCSLNTVAIKALSKNLITEDELDAATDPDASHTKRCMAEIFKCLTETIKESPSQFQELLVVLKEIGPPVSTIALKISNSE